MERGGLLKVLEVLEMSQGEPQSQPRKGRRDWRSLVIGRGNSRNPKRDCANSQRRSLEIRTSLASPHRASQWPQPRTVGYSSTGWRWC